MDVSIIIPTFNRLWSLPNAVESCRSTECRLEIIVVDDGSTDGTWQWLQQQPGIVALRQQNLGKDWAVNRGFAAAKGEYIRFLDSDDWCLPHANDAQLSLGRATGADVVVGGYSVYDEHEQLIAEHHWIHCDDFIAQQLGECPSSHYSAYLFRRAFIHNVPHRQEAGVRDDRLFILEVALLEPKVAEYHGLAFAHRHHNSGRLQFPRGIRATVTNYQHLAIYRRILGELDAVGELSPRRKRAAARILWPLAHWIAYTHIDEAAAVAAWIYRLVPEFIPPEPGLLGALYRHVGFARTERILSMRRLLMQRH